MVNKINGISLNSNLDRQGEDLQFSTNGAPLLSLNFAGNKVAVNANANLQNSTFSVNGNVLIGGLTIDNGIIGSSANITFSPTGFLLLGNVGNVKISGGQSFDLLTTDGNGNASWTTPASIASQMGLVGSQIPIGTPSDGSLVQNSAYKYWNATTTISDACDTLNQVMRNVYQKTYVGDVSFTANVVQGACPLAVQFTPTIFGDANAYFWEFGDGTTSNSQNPSHVYNNVSGGLYSVYFKAFNTNGTNSGIGQNGALVSGLSQGAYADTSMPNFITVYTPLPIPTYTMAPQNIDSGGSSDISNTSQYSTSYVAYWGDGSTTVIPDNASPGGIGGSFLSHKYTNVAGDTQYQMYMSAFSATSSVIGNTVIGSSIPINVFSIQTSLLSANAAILNNVLGANITINNGYPVTFYNNVITAPGKTAIFNSNSFEFVFGDGIESNVNIGGGTAGDIGIPLVHIYALSDAQVAQTFYANLIINTGSTFSPFISAPVSVTVRPSPTSIFSVSAAVISDRIGDSASDGYLFVDLNGNNRANLQFMNDSINSTYFTWNFGDGATSGNISSGAGTPSGGTLFHAYASVGTAIISLLSYGVNSLNLNDNTSSTSINILQAPAPPVANVANQVVTFTSVGQSPLLAYNFKNNSINPSVTAGSSVTRITTVDPLLSNSWTNVYSAGSGTLSIIYNGVLDLNSSVTFTNADHSGIYGSLNITSDIDMHALNASIYPSNFYRVFSGYFSKPEVNVVNGYNEIYLSHSIVGNSAVSAFVKDDVIASPILSNSLATMSVYSPGIYTYVSGIPYFGVNGQVSISGLSVSQWIGQTYLGVTAPLSVTSGVIQPQWLSYQSLQGTPTYLVNGIPSADTGNSVPYVFGNLIVNINGVSSGSATLNASIQNVVGTSNTITMPTIINYMPVVTGFNEIHIPVSSSLGTLVGSIPINGGNGLRVILSDGATPVFANNVNYLTQFPFTGDVNISVINEAVILNGKLQYCVADFSNMLPIGPNLSSRLGAQYFKFAFQRSVMSNFTITYSGSISGMFIAAPGTTIDSTSTLNGWLDCTKVYAGSGVPGANANLGGNGSNGCASNSGSIIPVGSIINNLGFTMTLGSENSSNSYDNQILICLVFSQSDYITSLSVGQ